MGNWVDGGTFSETGSTKTILGFRGERRSSVLEILSGVSVDESSRY